MRFFFVRMTHKHELISVTHIACDDVPPARPHSSPPTFTSSNVREHNRCEETHCALFLKKKFLAFYTSQHEKSIDTRNGMISNWLIRGFNTAKTKAYDPDPFHSIPFPSALTTYLHNIHPIIMNSPSVSAGRFPRRLLNQNPVYIIFILHVINQRKSGDLHKPENSFLRNIPPKLFMYITCMPDTHLSTSCTNTRNADFLEGTSPCLTTRQDKW